MLDAIPTIKVDNPANSANTSYGNAYSSNSIIAKEDPNEISEFSDDQKATQGYRNTVETDLKKTSQGKEYEHKSKGIGEETRKTEIVDGELTVRVYDTKGRLIRMIPPGYVPPNKSELDILA